MHGKKLDVEFYYKIILQKSSSQILCSRKKHTLKVDVAHKTLTLLLYQLFITISDFFQYSHEIYFFQFISRRGRTFESTSQFAPQTLFYLLSIKITISNIYYLIL